MSIRYSLSKKVDRLNDIFEREHLPYAAKAVPESRMGDMAEIFDTDSNTDTGIYIIMSFNNKCSMHIPDWHDIVDANDLKLVRDICDCLLELNNNVITKSETKSTNPGTNCSDLIKAIMNNSTLMESTKNELIDIIVAYM